MSKVQLIVELEHPGRTYFPSEILSGKVVLNSTKEQKIEGIKITFLGVSKAKWQDPAQLLPNYYDYKSSETYFNVQRYLLGNGSDKQTLSTGTYTYPFTYILPDQLASSFIGKFGKICYKVIVTIKRGGWKSNISTVIQFTVNGLLDLNNEPRANQPVRVNPKNAITITSKVGTVFVNLGLRKQGYVIGEIIFGDIEIFNNSKNLITGARASLIQKIIYQANQSSNIETNILIVKNWQGLKISSGERKYWSDNLLKIPPIPPTHFGLATCAVINVEYYIEITAEYLSSEIKNEIPIIVGTTPLRTGEQSIPRADFGFPIY